MPSLAGIIAVLIFSTPARAVSPRHGRFSIGLEMGGSLSVGELLPIEFKPSPTADWSIIVPVPLYPGNGLDVGAAVEYYPTHHLGLRAFWGTQIPVQPMAALPSYIRDVSGSFHRMGLDVFGYMTEGRISLDAGIGVFCVLAGYEFMFDDFTTQEEDWEKITGETWTAGLNPHLGADMFLTENLALGGRLSAPISLISDDGNDDTEEEGFGNHGAGVQLRLHLKRLF